MFIGLKYTAGKLINVNTGREATIHPAWDEYQPSGEGCIAYHVETFVMRVRRCPTTTASIVLCSLAN